MEGSEVMVRAILRIAPNIEVATDFGYTPFLYAVVHGDVEFLRFMIDSGANYRATTKDGYTALHIAVFNNKGAALEFLLTTYIASSICVDCRTERMEVGPPALLFSSYQLFQRAFC